MRSVKQYLPTQQLYVALRSGRNAIKRSIIETLLTAFLGLFLAATALAQTSLTTLYSFRGVAGDGWRPVGDLSMDSQGALYGATTPRGGGGGSIFQLTPPAFGTGSWTKTKLYDGSAAGTVVKGKLSPVILGTNGELYGTSDNCVSIPFGCVFQLVPPVVSGGTWTMNVIHGFQGAAFGDGKQVAFGKLVRDASGNLYGVTQGGGVANTARAGTVYELNPPATAGGAWTEQILYKFQAVRGGIYFPQVNVAMDTIGNLYGSTRFAENLQGNATQGVIYQLAPPTVPGGAWTIRVINNTIGGNRLGAGVTQLTVSPSGTVFGVSTLAGGAFALTPPAAAGGAWTLSHLPSSSRGGPGWELALDAHGNLYGTDYDTQTAYTLTAPATSGGTWTYSLLHTFQGGSEGIEPSGRPLVDSSGNVFGATLAGGTGSVCKATGAHKAGCGTVFELQ